MVKVHIQKEYSWLKTAKKAVENGLVLFGPSILAFLAEVPPEYAWIAGIAAFALKDYLKHKN